MEPGLLIKPGMPMEPHVPVEPGMPMESRAPIQHNVPIDRRALAALCSYKSCACVEGLPIPHGVPMEPWCACAS